MVNLLNLRPEPQPIVKIVVKRRSFILESFKFLGIIAIVSGIVWGISRADETGYTPTKNWNAMGTIATLNGGDLTLIHATGSDGTKDTSYTVDISNTPIIQTAEYATLVISDLKVGDSIILSGTIQGSTITVKRIVSFSETVSSATTTVQALPEATTASTTASSTPEASTTPVSSSGALTPVLDVATTTPDVSTSTPEATTTPTASSTPEVVASSTPEGSSTPVVAPTIIQPTASDTPVVIPPTPEVPPAPPVETPPAPAPDPTPTE